jgi:hypothetical protein
VSEPDPGWLAGPPPPPPNPSEGEPAPRSAYPRPGATQPMSSPLAGGHQRVTLANLKNGSPWVLGAASVPVALAAVWLSDILLTFRHAPRETAQDRLLSLFGVGSVAWAVAVLLAAALLAAGRRFELGAASPALRELATLGVLAASVAVAACAAVDVLVELGNFGHGIDAAFSGLIGYLAVLPLAVAAGWWAFRLRSRP